MDRARRTAIIGSALRMEVRDTLWAFELAAPHAKGRTYKEKLAHQQDVALALLDWAITESDRGAPMLSERAECALTSRGDGTIIVGPLA